MIHSPYSRVKFLPPKGKRLDDTFVGEFPNGTTAIIDIPTALTMYDPQFLNFLKAYRNHWVAIPVGTPGCPDAPKSIISKIHIKFPQGTEFLCLASSLAIAIHYCGFPKVGYMIWEQAPQWAQLGLDAALTPVLSFMRVTLPVIGGATQFEKCTTKET